MEKKALGKGLSALISGGRSVEDVLKKEIPIEAKAVASREDKGVGFRRDDEVDAK